MRLSGLFFSVLCLVATTASAADDCTMDAKAIKPQLASKLPKGFKLLSTKKGKREITQVLQMPDKYELTVTMGGCEHLTYTLAFKGGTLTSKTVGSELVAVSKRLLPQVPVAKDAHVDTKLFLKALDEANIIALPAELPCGDARCSLAIDAVEAAKPPKGKKPKKPEPATPPADPPGVMKLSYDFAL